MGLRQLLRNAVFGLGLALTPGCSSDPDWSPEGEAEGEISEVGYVEHQHRTTDADGEATFSREGREIPVRVADTEGNPLAGIDVHYAFKDDKNLVLAVDPEGRFVPDKQSFSASVPAVNARRAGLSDLISFALDNVDVVGTIVEEVSTPRPRDLIEEREDVNRYCMNMEDILNTTIDVPAGLIFLAPQVAGMDATLLRVAVGTLLRDNVELYIISRFGEQPGYEVWVPKTAVSLCGEEYNDIICDLSEGQLERLWNTDLPYWRINEGCVPSSGDGERCGGSPLVNLYAWKVHDCQGGTQELADGNCRVVLEAEIYPAVTLTVDGNQFWSEDYPEDVVRFTRNASKVDFSECFPGGLAETMQCAVNTDPEIYLGLPEGDSCRFRGIYRLTSMPWPGVDDCHSQERNQLWNSKCGHGGY